MISVPFSYICQNFIFQMKYCLCLEPTFHWNFICFAKLILSVLSQMQICTKPFLPFVFSALATSKVVKFIEPSESCFLVSGYPVHSGLFNDLTCAVHLFQAWQIASFHHSHIFGLISCYQHVRKCVFTLFRKLFCLHCELSQKEKEKS